MLEVLRPGVQTTLQARPRTGCRHMGVPWAGPADDWSMALANHLVGNAPDAAALEITLGSFSARFSKAAWIALAGAEARADISGEAVSFHRTLHAPAKSVLTIDAAPAGMRIYLAVAGGFEGENFLGSTSTYLPAVFGGYQGRALAADDHLTVRSQPDRMDVSETPQGLRPAISDTYALRACPSAETHLLSDTSRETLFNTEFTIGRQATRMGAALEGETLHLSSDGKMKSAAVFPGTIQCPEDGTPIILLADAQTTGGYPRIASIAGCDRHMLGQLRPGNRVRLLKRSPEQAAVDLKSKLAMLRTWIPNYSA